MTNPWEVPPIPLYGDPKEDDTYMGVGRVLSAWEGVELVLGQIYSHFVGMCYQLGAFHEYGAGRIFSERFVIIARAAEKFFVKWCDQDLEGEFLRNSLAVHGFSNRRNDVAHGIVRPKEWIEPIDPFNPLARTPTTFLLVPPQYKFSKFDQNNRPTYAYNLAMLLQLDRDLFNLRLRLLDVDYKALSLLSPLRRR